MARTVRKAPVALGIPEACRAASCYRPVAPSAGNRVSVNLRLSKESGDSNTSLDGMLADCEALAAAERLVIVAVHVDDGLSGGYRDRPEFQAWIADAVEGRADALMAWHVDRMTREGTNVAARLFDVVEGKDPNTGRPLHPPKRLLDTRGLDSNDGDSFRWRFLVAAEVARGERERIRDRARAKDERLRRAGRWPGGPPPFGYRTVRRCQCPGQPFEDHGCPRPGKTLAPHLGEVAVIRRASEKLLHGWPLGRVVRWLNAEGCAPRRAAAWSRTTLRQVLTGDAVLGRMVVKGEVLRDPDDGSAVEVFPPILTLAQSATLRQLLAPRPDETGRKGGRLPSRLLSGGLLCHACGHSLQVARRSDGSVTYRCQTQSDGGLCPAQVVVAALPIEEWVTDFYLRRFGPLLETERRVVADGSEDVAALDDAIAATLASLGKEATAEGFARLQDLQARRAEAAERDPVGPVVKEVLTGRSKAQEWAAQDVEGRREMLRRDLGSLVLGPGTRGRRGFDPARLVGFELDAFPHPADVGLGGSSGASEAV